MAVLYPVIGQWFSRPNGTLFEVVAVDEDDGTVEGYARLRQTAQVHMQPGELELTWLRLGYGKVVQNPVIERTVDFKFQGT